MAAVPRLTEKEVPQRSPDTNPYVGPRAFREQDHLYGREQELAELVDLLVAERVVLMYSPSGAGKTSLIQASLIPELRRQRFRPLPPARVNLPVPTGTDVNQYAMSVMLSLESQLRPPHKQRLAGELATIRLPEYLRIEAGRKPSPVEGIDNEILEGAPMVLIIDQFEEILRLDEADQDGQGAFFRQLGDALDGQRLWALLSMREEYLGGLDKFSYKLPTSLNVRYRLDLLTRPAAKSAIQRPPEREHGVTISGAAADLLVKNLSTIIVQRPGSSASREESPYVEGVLLQTVCRQIWDDIDPLRKGIKTIKPEDLGDFQNVDRALAKYYSDAVARAARSAKLRERVIRDWFEDVLITAHGIRSQTDSGPGEDPRKGYRCILSLEKQHLVRSEPRLNRPWYELIHDRLIEPVRNDNAAWREQRGFGYIARRAKRWRDGRPRYLLLTGNAVAEGILWLDRHGRDVYDYEREFVEESERVLNEQQKQEVDRQLSEQREQIYHGVFMDLTMSRRKWRWATLLVVVFSAVAIVIIVLARI